MRIYKKYLTRRHKKGCRPLIHRRVHNSGRYTDAPPMNPPFPLMISKQWVAEAKELGLFAGVPEEWDDKFNPRAFKEGIPMWEKLPLLPEIDNDTLEEIWAAYDQAAKDEEEEGNPNDEAGPE